MFETETIDDVILDRARLVQVATDGRRQAPLARSMAALEERIDTLIEAMADANAQGSEALRREHQTTRQDTQALTAIVGTMRAAQCQQLQSVVESLGQTTAALGRLETRLREQAAAQAKHDQRLTQLIYVLGRAGLRPAPEPPVEATPEPSEAPPAPVAKPALPTASDTLPRNRRVPRRITTADRHDMLETYLAGAGQHAEIARAFRLNKGALTTCLNEQADAEERTAELDARRRQNKLDGQARRNKAQPDTPQENDDGNDE